MHIEREFEGPGVHVQEEQKLRGNASPGAEPKLFYPKLNCFKTYALSNTGPLEAMLHPDGMLSTKHAFFQNIAAGGNALAPQGQR